MCERDTDWLPLTSPQLGTWPTTQAGALTGNRASKHSIHWATPARAKIFLLKEIISVKETIAMEKKLNDFQDLFQHQNFTGNVSAYSLLFNMVNQLLIEDVRSFFFSFLTYKNVRVWNLENTKCTRNQITCNIRIHTNKRSILLYFLLVPFPGTSSLLINT